MKSGQFSGSLTAEKGRSSLICFKCGEAGHIASKCNKSSNQYSSNNKSGLEKRVDACEVIEPKGVLSQSVSEFWTKSTDRSRHYATEGKSSATKRIRLAVLPKAFPDSTLTREDQGKIEDAIVE
ncbi:PREDICTED: uncharacterized protein LOC108374082 [Rhagoletis zephyria]|uniref:uncharacterized protein LOC108374082 n=1 Tax=Rhagoletis zephyria TaxID=28612 RepID=UPI0008112394|nr:PREDICTED: uncharacterized protein LOC108374082 [Rhagoletis zephyria]